MQKRLRSPMRKIAHVTKSRNVAPIIATKIRCLVAGACVGTIPYSQKPTSVTTPFWFSFTSRVPISELDEFRSQGLLQGRWYGVSIKNMKQHASMCVNDFEAFFRSHPRIS